MSVDLPSSTLPHVMKRSRSLVLVRAQVGLDVGADQLRDVRHQKYPSTFFFSIDAD